MPIFSVVVREDKKLLTVLFPDGRDGRAFTLKVFVYLISFFQHDLFYLIIFSQVLCLEGGGVNSFYNSSFGCMYCSYQASSIT